VTLFSLLLNELKEFMDAAVPVAAQAVLVYLIVRFALAVANVIVELTFVVPQANANRAARPEGAPAPPGLPAIAGPPGQLPAGPPQAGIPERATSS